MTRMSAVVVIGMVTVVAVFADGNTDDLDSSGVGKANAQICGSRVTHYILEHYGKQVDLIELTHQMQWPDLDAGTSLARIKTTLESHGVACKAVRLGNIKEFRWKNPVVLHLKGPSDAIGHFVVWLPTSSRSTWQVWDGVFGVREISRDSIEVQLSDIALLTSVDGMEDLGTCAFLPNGHAFLIVTVLLVLVIVFACHPGVRKFLFQNLNERK